jgi:hypothetical protein
MVARARQLISEFAGIDRVEVQDASGRVVRAVTRGELYRPEYHI